MRVRLTRPARFGTRSELARPCCPYRRSRLRVSAWLPDLAVSAAMYPHLWCDRAGRPVSCLPRSFGYGEAVAGNEVASDHQAGLAGLAESLDRLLQSPGSGLRRAGYRASRPGRRLGANGAIFITLAVLV